MITNPPLFLERIVTLTGRDWFAKLELSKSLIDHLTDQDLGEIIANNVYILPMFSPSSKSEIPNGVPTNSQIIAADMNNLSLFTVRERTAILLHEIGHALRDSITTGGLNKEFAADDFAADHGFADGIISSLPKLPEGQIINNLEKNRQRAERMKQRLQA